MSELEKAWIRRRTATLVAEGLGRSAAKMIAMNELLRLQRRITGRTIAYPKGTAS
ncbi:MAG: hypothetical protein AAFO81_03080 [Pseudomonadota bacterium]